MFGVAFSGADLWAQQEALTRLRLEELSVFWNELHPGQGFTAGMVGGLTDWWIAYIMQNVMACLFDLPACGKMNEHGPR